MKVELSLQNLSLSKGQNLPIVLAGGERREIFTLNAKKPQKHWQYNFRFLWARGDFTARPNVDHVYVLPYEKGKQFEVSQGCNGVFSHYGDQRFAIDFSMPVGTPIHAARGGKVVRVEESFDEGGPSNEYKDLSNMIAILHSDRTLGLYYHLVQDGAIVELGQMIKAGQHIGFSGNTGFSSGPHLHFEVTKVADGFEEDESIPITFSTKSGNFSCFKKGSIPIAR